ncbi:AAA family ATPase [Paenibacillus qinlingensis]|uniref:MinD-like ATPase involved in chromosome partitioning or flagellar assembly n=1 Tax=Paenibacillus qinlingensis TaxID=1837343 RepID=A0ABU1NVQ8_9BACL|nr:AAA family ATPase [Paenibacillus qinlingensis]MDR6551564.1 MinD-like ATPase involved in chromosome partitioning or flagellar assembly [Paenibacillus qinlingensis]
MKAPLVITLHSPQGGSGKSTLALNLALQYAKQGKKTLLVDMAGYGGLPAMCKIPIRGSGLSSLITVLEQSVELPNYDHFAGYFKDAIVPYKDIRDFHLLLSASPLKMEKLSSVYTDYLIETAKKEDYAVILVDTSSELCERNIACIESADLLLIPTLQDVASGWKVILFKEILASLHIPKEKVYLIANRVTKYSGFSNKEFQEEIGFTLLSEIPDISKQVQRHVNSGIPMDLSGKRKVSAMFQQLAQKIMLQVV